MEWMSAFFADETSPKTLAVCIDLIYFNSSSAKQLFDFIDLLDKNNAHFDIRIQWRYDTDNESALEEGEGLIDDFPGLAIDLVLKTSA